MVNRDRGQSLGKSKLVPFINNHKQRHKRRFEIAVENEPILREWCENVGIDFRLYDGYVMWSFSKDNARAIWTPSTARLRIKYNWRSQRRALTFHAHDFRQVQNQLHEYLLKKKYKIIGA